MANNSVRVEIIGDASSLDRALKAASGQVGGFSTKIGHAAKLVGLLGGAAALGGLYKTMSVGYSEWQQQAKVAAQTAAVIKSTGGSANVTAKQVDDLSSSILRKTGIDDEAVKAGENMLLTFTKVRNEAGKGNDVFNQSTKILADMSTALGTDMPKSAIQLGKALNDPVKGISALSRVGVTFDQAQKDQIKGMVASGDTMGAQKLILGELTKEFGGSAEAAGKTLPGQLKILKEEFNNLSGEVFTKLVPALQATVEWITAHWPQISAVMGAVFTGVAYVVENLVWPALKMLAEGVRIVVEYVKAHWTEIHDTVLSVWNGIEPILQFVADAFKLVADVVVASWPFIERNLLAVKTIVVDAVKIIGAAFRLVIDLIHGDWGGAWGELQTIVSTAFDLVLTYMTTVVQNVKGVALAVGKAILWGIEHGAVGLVGMASGLIDGIVGIISGAIGRIADAGLSLGKGLVGGIVDGLSFLAGELVKLIRGPINAIIGAVDSIQIPSFGLHIDTHIPGVGKVGFEYDGSGPIFNIPKLDVGGTILESGIAVVHKGEVVVPATGKLPGLGGFANAGSGLTQSFASSLARMVAVPNDRGGGIGGTSGGTTVHVTVNGWVGSDQQIADKVVQVVNRKIQAQGYAFRAV